VTLGPFARVDATDDSVFYAMDRKVTHLGDGAIESLRATYLRLLPPGGAVLDLMSSWRSHLPAGLGVVTGLGMNSAEMADNPQLDTFGVHDLNRDPNLPFADGSFDAVVCAVSVQYLVRPVEVFADVRRVLRPGGPVIISFSNRCFPAKAVRVWLEGTDSDHARLVKEYLEAAGFQAVLDMRVPSPDDPLYVVSGSKPT
jgi:SAM-dependent methyltransferase